MIPALVIISTVAICSLMVCVFLLLNQLKSVPDNNIRLMTQSSEIVASAITQATVESIKAATTAITFPTPSQESERPIGSVQDWRKFAEVMPGGLEREEEDDTDPTDQYIPDQRSDIASVPAGEIQSILKMMGIGEQDDSNG